MIFFFFSTITSSEIMRIWTISGGYFTLHRFQFSWKTLLLIQAELISGPSGRKKGRKRWWKLQRVGSLTIPGTEGGSQYAHQWECDTEKACDWTAMTRPPGWGGWWDIHQSQACNWCGSHWRQTWRYRKQCNVASAKKTTMAFIPNGLLQPPVRVCSATDCKLKG